MDEDRLSGTNKNLEERAKDTPGPATGDDKTNARHQTQQVENSVEDLYGQAKDAAGEAINAVGKMPASVEETIRHHIQKRPLTTVAIAFAVGWLVGRSHRPF